MPIIIVDREGFELTRVATVECRTITRGVARGDIAQIDAHTFQLVREHGLRPPTPAQARKRYLAAQRG